jgi:hypothetical protein
MAEKSEEIKALLEVGFECVCQKDEFVFLRKRKLVTTTEKATGVIQIVTGMR